MEVILQPRNSSVLTHSGLACLSRVPTVNLTAGCAHGCLYCYARGYRTYPGDGKVVVYADTAARLRGELRRRRRPPQAVYFSPSSDLFQLVPAVLETAYDVLDLLLGRGIGVAFLTKGRIPEPHLALLAAHAGLVHAQVGLTTLDEHVTQALEPHAAPPLVRLEQLRRLASAGIETQARLDPILPGLTDDSDTLESLAAAVAGAGVRRMAASLLFVRPAIAASLARIPDRRMRDALLGAFRAAGPMDIQADGSSVIALPAEVRRQTYARLESSAARHGVAVHVCACKNPDLATDPCGLSGDRRRPPRFSQPSLWEEPLLAACTA